MSSNWLDDPDEPVSDHFEGSMESFYCPYTNGPKCALITKGWQPQELCGVLDCQQLRLFRASRRRRPKAA